MAVKIWRHGCLNDGQVERVGAGKQPFEADVRRPRIGDLRGMRDENPTIDEIMEIISRITEQPLPVIRQLDMADFVKVREVMENFLPNIPRIGGKE